MWSRFWKWQSFRNKYAHLIQSNLNSTLPGNKLKRWIWSVREPDSTSPLQHQQQYFQTCQHKNYMVSKETKQYIQDRNTLTLHKLSLKKMTTNKVVQGFQNWRTGSLILTQMFYSVSTISDQLHIPLINNHICDDYN